MSKTGLLGKVAAGAILGAVDGHARGLIKKEETAAQSDLRTMTARYDMLSNAQRYAYASARDQQNNTFQQQENDKTRQANGNQLIVGSPLQGDDGTYYGVTRKGGAIPISAGDEPIKGPTKKGLTEKDQFNALLREAGRIREQNADNMGDLTEEEILIQARANVENARKFGLGKTPKPQTMEAGGALPLPEDKTQLVSGQTYQTPKGDLLFKEGRWWQPENPLSGASEEQLTKAGKEQSDLGPSNQVAPVKSSLTQEVPTKPKERKTWAGERRKRYEATLNKAQEARRKVDMAAEARKRPGRIDKPLTWRDNKLLRQAEKLEAEAEALRRKYEL